MHIYTHTMTYAATRRYEYNCVYMATRQGWSTQKSIRDAEKAASCLGAQAYAGTPWQRAWRSGQLWRG